MAFALPAPPAAWFAEPDTGLDLPFGARPAASGKRASVAAEESGWELRLHPAGCLHGAFVTGARPGPGRLEPGGVRRLLDGGGLVERWIVAGEVPAAAWEVTGAAERLRLEWSMDLRLPWVDAEPDMSPVFERSEGEGRLALFGDDRRVEIVTNGRVRACAGPGPGAVEVVCDGTPPLRVLIAAGTDPGELVRVAGSLGREDPSASATRQDRQALRTTTLIEIPDPALQESVRWSVRRLGALVATLPGIGRAPLARRGRWRLEAGSVRAAVADLAVGRRETARDLIQLLSRALDPTRDPEAARAVGALGWRYGAREADAVAGLLQRYLAWTGDRAFLQRHPELAAWADSPPAAVVPSDLFVAGERFRTDPVAPFAETAADLAEAAATGLWGIAPDAAGEALVLRPSLPDGWARAALRRLRVGGTVLDLEVRRRGSELVVRVHRVFGPRLTVTVAPRGDYASAVVDDVELGVPRARFEMADRHEVRFPARL